MPKFMKACFSRMNGYRADRDIVAARVPLQIAAEGSEGYLTDTKLCKRSVYVPCGQLDRRQFLAFGLRQGKDTSDGFKPDNSRFLVLIVFGTKSVCLLLRGLCRFVVSELLTVCVRLVV